MTLLEKFTEIVPEAVLDRSSIDYGKNYGFNDLAKEHQLQIEDLIKEYLGFKQVQWIKFPVGVITNIAGNQQQVAVKTTKIPDQPTKDHEGKLCYLYQVFYSPQYYIDPFESKKISKVKRFILMRFDLDNTQA